MRFGIFHGFVVQPQQRLAGMAGQLMQKGPQSKRILQYMDIAQQHAELFQAQGHDPQPFSLQFHNPLLSRADAAVAICDATEYRGRFEKRHYLREKRAERRKT